MTGKMNYGRSGDLAQLDYRARGREISLSDIKLYIDV